MTRTIDQRGALGDKAQVLQEIGAQILPDPIAATLAKMKAELEEKIVSVSQRIADAVGQHIKVSGRREKRRWRLLYSSEDKPVNSPLFGKLPGVASPTCCGSSISTMVLKSFSHVLNRYVKHDPDPRELLACIVAMSTKMGIGKKAEVSGMNSASMLTMARNFLRQETLHAINDAINNAIAVLPAFHL